MADFNPLEPHRYKIGGPDTEINEAEAQALTWCQVVFVMRTREDRRTLADRELVMAYATAIETYRLTMTVADIEARRVQGLARLMEKGIVECVRDGNGDWQPVTIHEERLDRRQRLVTGNFQ